MADQMPYWQRPRFWIGLIALIILLIFLNFFEPFEKYVIQYVPQARFDNVLFWFSAVVAVIGFGAAHWQSFRRHIFGVSGRIPVEDLVFDTLQISILGAVILLAGATLQEVEMLSQQLLFQELAVEQSFVERILTIFLLIILAILFYLLHIVVRAFRTGWQPRRPPPRGPSSAGNPSS